MINKIKKLLNYKIIFLLLINLNNNNNSDKYKKLFIEDINISPLEFEINQFNSLNLKNRRINYEKFMNNINNLSKYKILNPEENSIRAFLINQIYKNNLLKYEKLIRKNNFMEMNKLIKIKYNKETNLNNNNNNNNINSVRENLLNIVKNEINKKLIFEKYIL